MPEPRKIGKADADYRLGSKNRRCDQCNMFIAPHDCTLVYGVIEENAVCDFFMRKAT